MNAHSFFSLFVYRFIHILVVLSIALTSAVSATGVKRAAAQAPAAEGSGLSISALFSQVVPLAHRRQALRERVARFLGLDEGNPAFQEIKPMPTGCG